MVKKNYSLFVLSGGLVVGVEYDVSEWVLCVDLIPGLCGRHSGFRLSFAFSFLLCLYFLILSSLFFLFSHLVLKRGVLGVRLLYLSPFHFTIPYSHSIVVK